MANQDKPVTELMQQNLFALWSDDPLDKVERLFLAHRLSLALVFDKQQQFLGLLTRNHLLATLAAGLEKSLLRAEDLCCSKVSSCTPRFTVKEAGELMLRKGADFLVVMDGEKVLGLVSPHSLLREVLQELRPSSIGKVAHKNFFVGL
jgi:CBS domain-containing protein